MRRIIVAVLTAIAAFVQPAAAEEGWPSRPLTMVVPFAAGGPTDTVARTLGASMSKTLGQTVVIENKLGAGGTIAANYVYAFGDEMPSMSIKAGQISMQPPAVVNFNSNGGGLLTARYLPGTTLQGQFNTTRRFSAAARAHLPGSSTGCGRTTM